MMWKLYFALSVFIAMTVGIVSSVIASVYFNKPFADLVVSWTKTTNNNSSIHYSCGSGGTCSETKDGQFATMDECVNYCDRAACFDNSKCVVESGNLNLGTMAECQALCGKENLSTYICSTDSGCREARAGEIGTFSDGTCNGQCITYDLVGDKCVAVTQTTGKYLTQQECENAEYTWKCDYPTSTCKQDDGVKTYVPGPNEDPSITSPPSVDAVNVAHFPSEAACTDKCNPKKYATCEGYERADVCVGKNEGDVCYDPNNDCGGWKPYTKLHYHEGVCTFCANDNYMSGLVCKHTSDEKIKDCGECVIM